MSSVALKVPYGARIDAVAAAGGHSLRGRGPGLFAWLAWALLCLALARPQQLGPPVAPPQAGRDLMLAVDLSGSMDEEDMQLGGEMVDRLTAAKAVLADFLDRRVGDRVGLLVFGERAYTLTPLTLDRTSVREQLADSVVGLAGRATAIGDAIGLAVKRLRNQPSQQRVLILLTDGVNTAGVIAPDKATELAKAEGVRVHTIAFGGDGGSLSVFGFRLPMPGGGEDIDEAGLQTHRAADRRTIFPRPRHRIARRHLCRDRSPGTGAASRTGGATPDRALSVAIGGGAGLRIVGFRMAAAETGMNAWLPTLHFIAPAMAVAVACVAAAGVVVAARGNVAGACGAKSVDPHLLPHLLEPWRSPLAQRARGGPGGLRARAAGTGRARVAQGATPLWQGQTPLVVALDLSSAALAVTCRHRGCCRRAPSSQCCCANVPVARSRWWPMPATRSPSRR